MVSAATCMYMVMFGAAASMFMFLIYGRFNLYYSLWVGLFSGIGVFLGLFVMRHIMKRYKRPSLIAFALATTIAIATVLAVYSNIRTLITKLANDVDILQGDSLC